MWSYNLYDNISMWSYDLKKEAKIFMRSHDPYKKLLSVYEAQISMWSQCLYVKLRSLWFSSFRSPSFSACSCHPQTAPYNSLLPDYYYFCFKMCDFLFAFILAGRLNIFLLTSIRELQKAFVQNWDNFLLFSCPFWVTNI